MKRTIKLSIVLASLGWAIGCGGPEPVAEGGSSSTVATDETYTTAGGESLEDAEAEDAPEAQ